MNRILPVLFIVFAFFSCNDNENYYSYLNEPDEEAEQVKIRYNMPEAPFLFDHIVRAREIFIYWGDSSHPEEYILANFNEIDSIKAIKHNYSSSGEYNLTLRTIYLTSLFLSRSGDNYISELDIKNTNRLRKLYCDGQPIPELDISGCPELRILSCGNLTNPLQLTGLEIPKKLAEIYLYGNTRTESLDLTENDSLKVLYLKGSDTSDVLLSDLEMLTSIQIDSCTQLNDIRIGNNPLLENIFLSGNPSLDARGLNALFSDLPEAGEGYTRTIILRRNKGDNSCDRSIATRKGWAFN